MIRKFQIQAWEAQALVIKALRDQLQEADGDEQEIVRAIGNADNILKAMDAAGYTPRRWGVGLAARWETGDETPEEMNEYNNAEWGGM